MKIACNPDARFDIEVSELELRRTERGRTLMARLYAPKGVGPFPVLLDLHGGAWNNKDRTANETMGRAVAASGVLVAAIDMTLAPEAGGHIAELLGIMVQNTGNWFKPWETIYEANPQQILERREKVALPPLLIMQGALDDNVLPSLHEKFAASYRAAGGECRLEIFEGCEHLWIDTPGPQTDHAHAMVKAFIARNLAKMGSEPRVLSSAPRY